MSTTLSEQSSPNQLSIPIIEIEMIFIPLGKPETGKSPNMKPLSDKLNDGWEIHHRHGLIDFPSYAAAKIVGQPPQKISNPHFMYEISRYS